MGSIEATVDGDGLRFAIAVSRFNHPICRRLLVGCRARLDALGCPEPDVIWVPGAFELPLAVQTALETGRYAGAIALGVVIRGGTPHFDYVCRGVTDGVRDVAQQCRAPVAFGVLTTDTAEQALDRAAAPGEPGSNKGAEAADAAVEMANLLRRLRKGD